MHTNLPESLECMISPVTFLQQYLNNDMCNSLFYPIIYIYIMTEEIGITAILFSNFETRAPSVLLILFV